MNSLTRTSSGTISDDVLGQFAGSDEDEDAHVTSAESLDTIVNEHRANDGLWHKAETPMEASLQHELRRLHTACDEYVKAARDSDVHTAGDRY